MLQVYFFWNGRELYARGNVVNGKADVVEIGDCEFDCPMLTSNPMIIGRAEDKLLSVQHSLDLLSAAYDENNAG